MRNLFLIILFLFNSVFSFAKIEDQRVWNNIYESCIINAKSNNTNQFTSEEILGYCQCSAEEITNSFTMQDLLLYEVEIHTLSKKERSKITYLNDKIKDIYLVCMSEIIESKNFQQQPEAKNKKKYIAKKLPIEYKATLNSKDDIGVIIANGDYQYLGEEIPNVDPAYSDAESMKEYFMKGLGIKEGNIIYLRDATAAQITKVFGNEKSHKGQASNWVKPNVSKLYVYYVGHGAPDTEKGNSYLVPSDASAQMIELSGYSLNTLYKNLSQIPAKSITVILEPCFSGISQGGSLFSKASPITIVPVEPVIPKNIKIISAGSSKQIASWEEDKSNSLFTKYFLYAMSGEGDLNQDGKISDEELKNYLDDNLTYAARRYYGRDQTAEIYNGN